MQTVTIQTHARDEWIDVTDQVRAAIAQSSVERGICLIHCPHTTAGITINENADPAVVGDLIAILDRLVPFKAAYSHQEGNSAAHAKSSLLGCSATLIIEDGRPVLGTWQSVFFCEFDGPRTRKLQLQVISA